MLFFSDVLVPKKLRLWQRTPQTAPRTRNGTSESERIWRGVHSVCGDTSHTENDGDGGVSAAESESAVTSVCYAKWPR
jgi:hypothetical protein